MSRPAMDHTIAPPRLLPATSQLGRLRGFREGTLWPAPTPLASSDAHWVAASSSQQLRLLQRQSQQVSSPLGPQGRSLSVPVTAAAFAVAASACSRRCPQGYLPTGLRRHGWPAKLRAAPQAAEGAPQATEVSRRTAWTAAFAYMLLSLLHRRLLGALAASGAPAPCVSLAAAVHAAVFLSAAVLLRRRQTGPGGINFILVATFVASELLSWMTLGRLAAAGDLALTVAVLSGSAIPFTMLLSVALLKRRFTPLAWVGAMLVAAGVASCGLGAPASLPGAAQAALLVGALAAPGLALVGKEAALTGSRPLGIASGALLLSLAQLGAGWAQPAWPPAAHAAPAAAALLWSPGAGAVWLYVLASGALRLSLIWALQVASAPTVQLLNALAVPLGAAVLGAGSPRNIFAVALSCVGAFLYLGAHLGWPTMPEKAQQGEEGRAPITTPEEAKKALQSAFLEEMRAASAEARKQKDAKSRRKARLTRLKERWSSVEAQQREQELEQAKIMAPRMFAAEVDEYADGDEREETNGSDQSEGSQGYAPLTKEEIEKIEMDEAYLGTMWEQWMTEHPSEWRRQEAASKRAEEERR
mmetsp:Transcript_8619/g.24198  ORF Transcript_8619/g.24198 Transcript_8619/m.24198 type:complete len:586 (-) Transcript_8619:192-1949(-)